MTNASVYKSSRFIAKNESVRIPDFEYERAPDETLTPLEASEPDEMSNNVETEPQIAEESAKTEEEDKLTVCDVVMEEEEKVQAKILSKEEIAAIYEQNLKELAASVAQQAYYDALNKKKAELRECIAGVQALMDEMVNAHKRFIDEYTNELKYMAIDIAEKMILEKIDEDDLILQRLVLQTVNSVKNAEWLNVEISERLVRLVDSIKEELEKPEYNGRAFVIPVAGSDSVCRVVTNEGAVVSTIEVQADNLRKAFRDFELQQ
ncbi:MAG: hypothetical protein GX488_01385 [Clostridiales bacterium]|nr:hypothetical protein [Clostridiales bacterium]